MLAILALVICTLLALSFSSTRGMGIVGVALCILVAPVITTVAVLIGGTVALFVFHRKKEM